MVEKIRELCKKNGTSIFKLEKQLGFGNGVIGRWDKAVPNYERLSAVANALGVTVADLTGEADEGIKKERPADSEALTRAKKRLYDSVDGLSAEQLDKLVGLIEEAKKLL